MSNKSHRAKALQSLIDAGPSTSAGQLLPPDSLVKPKTKKSSSSSKSKSKGKGKSKEVEELEKSRKGLGEDDEEEEEIMMQGGMDQDVEMDGGEDAGGWGASAGGEPEETGDDDAEMLIDASPEEIRARQILMADTSKPTPVLPLRSGAAASSSTTTPSAPTNDVNFVPLPSSSFKPLSAAAAANKELLKPETRKIMIPPHRMTPLKREWVNLYGPLVEMMGLMVRMNVGRKMVELKTSKHTPDQGAIQKGADFVKAFALGFDVKDALAILRLEDLYLDSFEIKDVKTLHGDHLSRAIGRIAGQDGKTKFVIENASRTRIVLADTHIHILGSVQNIKIARDAVVSLILGSPPGKVYATLKTIGARLKQRF